MGLILEWESTMGLQGLDLEMGGRIRAASGGLILKREKGRTEGGCVGLILKQNITRRCGNDLEIGR